MFILDECFFLWCFYFVPYSKSSFNPPFGGTFCSSFCQASNLSTYLSLGFSHKNTNLQVLNQMNQVPRGSMYGIFAYMYHKNQPNVGIFMVNVGKYTITWILWGWTPIFVFQVVCVFLLELWLVNLTKFEAYSFKMSYCNSIGQDLGKKKRTSIVLRHLFPGKLGCFLGRWVCTWM